MEVGHVKWYVTYPSNYNIINKLIYFARICLHSSATYILDTANLFLLLLLLLLLLLVVVFRHFFRTTPIVTLFFIDTFVNPPVRIFVIWRVCLSCRTVKHAWREKKN